MHDVLYQRAREELHRLELEGSRVDSVDVKEAQAWTLIAIYEFLRMHYRRGWMSLGRTCRLVQLLGLHKIDSEERLTNRAETTRNDTSTEERRRTFWMAFVLDRLVSMRNNWPLAFNELVVCNEGADSYARSIDRFDMLDLYSTPRARGTVPGGHN
jgi:hypothetical protein